MIVLAFGISSIVWADDTDLPNIVFFISDDQAWTDYGFMGHPQIETPNIDQLAARSAVFSRGYVPTALCRPSLATLMNGMYAHQHKISGNDPARISDPIPPTGRNSQTENQNRGTASKDAATYQDLRQNLIDTFYQHPTLAQRLGERGYLSFQSGKWWEGDPRRAGFTHAMTRGFPHPGGRHGDQGLKIGREGMEPVLEFIDHAVAEDKPFFVWYAPFLPHTPHNPPDRLFQKYKAKGITSDHVARYYAMVEWFDETCGELIDKLESAGLTENTLIVYVGDNGWIQQEQNPGYAPRSKQSANEGGTRQPTLFSWPGVIQPADRGQQLCSSVDIVPTALAAAGLSIPETLPGYNLLPVLKSGQPTPRQEVFGETFAHDIANIDRPEDSLIYRWVIVGRWKLLLTYDGKLGRHASSHPRLEIRPQLFDLVADPHEDHNLAAEHSEVVAELAERLQQWWPVTQRQVLTKWTEAQAASEDQPNVVFILIDDLGYADLGCYGSTFYETPRLDKMALEGAKFTSAYASCPVCSPTRASVMTGQWSSRWGITDYIGAPHPKDWKRNTPLLPPPNVDRLPLDAPTLAKAMKSAGYQTFFAGKWHLGPEGWWPENQGFDINRGGIDRGGPYGGNKYFSPYGNPRLEDGPEGEHLPTRLAQETANFISQNSDQPFFAYLSFYSVHTPLMAREDLKEKYQQKKQSLNLTNQWGREGHRDVRLNQSHAVYAGMVEAMDEAVGIVLDRLEELGLRENTLVIVTSDNGGLSTSEGWPTSNLPLRAGKGWMYEGGIREPLLIRWPAKVNAGITIDAPVSSPDFYPTLLQAAGVQPDEGQILDGVSLMPLLVGGEIRPRSLYWHYPHYGNQGGAPSAAIRNGKWKLIEWMEDQRVELFDLSEDIGETNDLADIHFQVADQLKAELNRWQQEVGAQFPTPNPAFDPSKRSGRWAKR